MQDFVYHNGQLVVEMCGDTLITRERGRYVSAPIRPVEPSHNPDFENQISNWLDKYVDEDRQEQGYHDGDIIPYSVDPFED